MPDALSSRDAILDAAERLFARQGFNATTVKQIGAESGVNSALLYYYFADKETLYREMLRRGLAAFNRAGVEQLTAALPPAEAIRRFARFQVDFMTAHPFLPRLLVRELLDHEAAHAEEQIATAAAGIFAGLCAVIRRGQAAGEFRADVDPRFAAISIVGQVAYMLIARPAAGILLGYGRGGPPPEVLREFARHAGDFAVAALAAPRTGRRATARTASRRAARSPAERPAKAAAPRKRKAS